MSTLCASETLCPQGFSSPEYLVQTLYSCFSHCIYVSVQMPPSLTDLTKEKNIHCHLSSPSPPAWSLCFTSPPIASIYPIGETIPLIPHLPIIQQYNVRSKRILTSLLLSAVGQTVELSSYTLVYILITKYLKEEILDSPSKQLNI